MDTIKPLVSILIPVYNRSSLISETIRSATSQTYKNIEIIVCDNKSTDDTFEVVSKIAKTDSRIKVFQNDRNLGPVNNWKKCVENATGKFSKILFSDDLINECFIETTLRIFTPDTSFVLSEIIIFDEDPINGRKVSSYSNRTTYTTAQYFKSVLLNNHLGFPVSPGAGLFRTKDLKSNILVDIPNSYNLEFNRYGAGNDLFIFLQTARDYSFIRIENNAISYFRSHDGSFTVSNNLDPFYDFSKYHFIKNFLPDFLPKFKTYLLSRKAFSKRDSILTEDLKGKIDLTFLIKIITAKLSRFLKITS